ncbi:MAG: DUF2842 domain-containing protein [Henriciella sp.]|uniref:DUF2842 domain-containing protein n=1 Tax=Henriciella sp. TaxID=1968823 RepID=UPI003C71C507
MRKVVTGLALLAFIAVWIIAAGTIGTWLAGTNDWLQLAFYVVAGVAWIIPLRPLLRWMNSAPPPADQS